MRLKIWTNGIWKTKRNWPSLLLWQLEWKKSLYKKIILSSPHTPPTSSSISNIFESYTCPFLKGTRRSLYNPFTELSCDLQTISLSNKRYTWIKQEAHTHTTYLLSKSLISGRNCSLSKDTLLGSISSCELYEIYSSKRRLQNKTIISRRETVYWVPIVF